MVRFIIDAMMMVVALMVTMIMVMAGEDDDHSNQVGDVDNDGFAVNVLFDDGACDDDTHTGNDHGD